MLLVFIVLAIDFQMQFLITSSEQVICLDHMILIVSRKRFFHTNDYQI
jgi:hypothetical protein